MPPESAINVLLVDDRPENLLALEATLRHPRYHFVKARSGAEALTELSTQEVALILLDVQMPEMDGFETARRIKRHPQHRDIPIIFITAINTEPLHVFQGYDSGAIDYLMKPFDDHVLRSKVAVIAELFEKNLQIQQHQRELTQTNAELQKEIWERQHAEQALRAAHAELEQRVQERTAALGSSNEALRLEIAERRRAEEQVRASLREKELLLKEIHHRVKNNLQVISSLLDLQAGYIQDPQALAMFQDSQNRVKSMALVHEQLYESRNLARINMYEYLQSLVEELGRSHGFCSAVEIRVDGEEVLLGVDAAIPCALLVNELITNALEHAFEPGQPGEVRVTLSAAPDGQCVVVVRDTGKGFPPGIDFRQTDSLGLTLVNALTEQLHGLIKLDGPPGTTFTVAFPFEKETSPYAATEDSHRGR